MTGARVMSHYKPSATPGDSLPRTLHQRTDGEPVPGPEVLVMASDGAVARSLQDAIVRLAGSATVVSTIDEATTCWDTSVFWKAVIVDLDPTQGPVLEFLAVVRDRDATVPVLAFGEALGRGVINSLFVLRAMYLMKPLEQQLIVAFLQYLLDSPSQSPALTMTERGHIRHGAAPRASLGRATWEYIQDTVADSPSRAAAARSLGISARSLRRMLQKEPPCR